MILITQQDQRGEGQRLQNNQISQTKQELWCSPEERTRLFFVGDDVQKSPVVVELIALVQARQAKRRKRIKHALCLLSLLWRPGRSQAIRLDQHAA